MTSSSSSSLKIVRFIRIGSGRRTSSGHSLMMSFSTWPAGSESTHAGGHFRLLFCDIGSQNGGFSCSSSYLSSCLLLCVCFALKSSSLSSPPPPSQSGFLVFFLNMISITFELNWYLTTISRTRSLTRLLSHPPTHAHTYLLNWLPQTSISWWVVWIWSNFDERVFLLEERGEVAEK